MSTRTLLKDAANRAANYLEAIDSRSVGPTPAAISALARFDRDLPEHPLEPEAILRELDETGSPGTSTSAGGRYFGFVIGGTLPTALAANMLATAWDQNAGLVVISPTTAKLETVALRWLLDALHLPATSGAGFVTGATMANFTCLAAARHALLKRAAWNVEEQGLFGAPPLTVIVGDEVHITLLKALSMLGLGRARVTRVPTDEQGRMRADLLPPLDDRTILCLQAGNVNTGAVDPMAELIARAHAARRMGARRRRLRTLGRRSTEARAARRRRRARRLVGTRRAQVAQRPVRQRRRHLPRRECASRRDRRERRVPRPGRRP